MEIRGEKSANQRDYHGAGKTTTIKSILGMVGYEAGEIALFDGVGGTRGDIGVVMDTPFYVSEWTAADVARAVRPFYPSWEDDTYTRLLAQFSIDPKKQVKALSRGMKVKLMLAVALSHNARLLILDEPTSGLDPVARDELCDLLREFVLDEGRGVLFSTHITADLEKVADYITFILDGRIVFTGAKEDLLERYVLVKGGPGELDAGQKKRLLGLREHDNGFTGMAEADSLPALPRTLLVEPITLDEIIIFMNKGAASRLLSPDALSRWLYAFAAWCEAYPAAALLCAAGVWVALGCLSCHIARRGYQKRDF